MNLATSHHTPYLQIMPKPLPTQPPMRQLTPKCGIQWTMISETFERFGWDIQAHTDLFIKASHPQFDYPMIVSRMGKSTVLLNQNFNTYIASALHEIEAIADLTQNCPITM